MASLFVIIRLDFLNLLPGKNTDSVKQCAAALLNFFRNQREGWLTINIPQFQQILFGQWGKEAIRKALIMLNDEKLIQRQHHRMNGKAWQYRLPEKVKKMEKIFDRDEVWVDLEEDSEDLDEDKLDSGKESVAPDKVLSIYKDPLIKIPFSDQQQDPARAKIVVEAEKGISPDEEVITEIKKIQCTPNIEIAPVVETARKHPENIAGAIAYTKNCIRTWDGRRQFNWTGVLIKALKEGLSSETGAKKTISNEPLRPDLPKEFITWSESKPNFKIFHYSELRSDWIAIFAGGIQRAWSEVKNDL